MTVTVADSHTGDVEEVAQRLRLAGMEVERVLAALGVITGSVQEDRMASIQALAGGAI